MIIVAIMVAIFFLIPVLSVVWLRVLSYRSSKKLASTAAAPPKTEVLSRASGRVSPAAGQGRLALAAVLAAMLGLWDAQLAAAANWLTHRVFKDGWATLPDRAEREARGAIHDHGLMSGFGVSWR